MTVGFLPGALAAFTLVLLAVGISYSQRLGLGRDITVASIRAAAQLGLVGFIFLWIFESGYALAGAWLWVLFMVANASRIVAKRARFDIPRLSATTVSAVSASAGLSLIVTFGFGVIDFTPVSLVVIAGITIGNAVPAAVLAAKQSVHLCRDRHADLESLLALGFDQRQVVRFMAPQAAKMAITPQIERTKVVGLIALPGAMTGLLLAGVGPLEAVGVQVLVMFLVLATVSVCVMSVTTTVVRGAITADSRPAPWTVISQDSVI